MKIKQKFFSALSHYHITLIPESTKYGVNVAHLTLALSLAKESLKLAQAFGPSQVLRLLGGSSDKSAASEALKESCRSLLNQVTSALAMSVKDNDLIYHDAVPNAEALDAVERLDAVKPLGFSDICPGGQADIVSRCIINNRQGL
jgi:hypothetical protein